MPHWESVFGHDYEVPGFVRFLIQKKILEDTSWGNDASPSFGVWDQTGDHRVVFWVDHPVSRRRHDRMPTEKRFHVQERDEIKFSSDDLDESLVELFKALGRFHGRTPPKGPKEWRPRSSKAVAEDWQEKLSELIHEYYDRQDR